MLAEFEHRGWPLPLSIDRVYDSARLRSELGWQPRFGPDDVLLVDQMLEPIIMGPTGLRKQGTVMLRKVEA